MNGISSNIHSEIRIKIQIMPVLHSTNYEEVKAVMTEAVYKGVESWNINLKFTPTGVSLLKLTNTTQDLLSY